MTSDASPMRVVAVGWPDVPWALLTAITVAAMVIVPLAFFPVSRTLWLAVDALLHRIDPDDTSAWIAAKLTPPSKPE